LSLGLHEFCPVNLGGENSESSISGSSVGKKKGEKSGRENLISALSASFPTWDDSNEIYIKVNSREMVSYFSGEKGNWRK